MGAPVLLTARHPPAAGTPAALCLAALLALMYLGFGVAALGDLTKTWVKAQKGEDALVTSGVFRWLRHPNYTGEACLWSANAAAAMRWAVSSARPSSWSASAAVQVWRCGS